MPDWPRYSSEAFSKAFAAPYFRKKGPISISIPS
jgi:hypothetical protein